MQLRRKAVSCLAALGVATGAVAGSATGAQAAALEFRIQVPKRLLVTTSKFSAKCGMDVWVWGTKGSTVAYSSVSLLNPDGSYAPAYKRVLPGAQVGYGIPCAAVAGDTGKYRLRVVALNKSGKVLGSRDETWYEKFDTVIKDANAAPEPVRKGRTLTVKGRLGRLNNLATGHTVYPGKTMRIYFRPKGSTTWRYMGSAKTGKDGRFGRNFTARQDGTWRSYFPGTSHFDRQVSRDDYVDVR